MRRRHRGAAAAIAGSTLALVLLPAAGAFATEGDPTPPGTQACYQELQYGPTADGTPGWVWVTVCPSDPSWDLPF